MSRPSYVQVLCPHCAASGRTVALSLKPEQTHSHCTECGRAVHVRTVAVVGSRQMTLENGRVRYEVAVEDLDQQRSVQTFIAQPFLYFRPGHWLTLVWYEGRLVGMADQNRNEWTRLSSPAPSELPLTRFWRLFLSLAVLLIIVQLYRLADELVGLWQRFGAGLLLPSVIVLFVVLAPFLLWVIRTARAGETRTE